MVALAITEVKVGDPQSAVRMPDDSAEVEEPTVWASDAGAEFEEPEV